MEDFDHLPKMAGWHESKLLVPEGQTLSFELPKPNYNITFHRVDEYGRNGEATGKFDFNGPEFRFEGNAEESAKVFVDWVANTFHGRLKEEYTRGYNDAKEGKEPQR